jgi:DNA-directed RNA polymerase subunit RPC12/RpoP
MTHYQLNYLCLYCNTAFIVLTKKIAPYHDNGTHCPDCGATGTCLRHDVTVDGRIDDIIPGDNIISHVGKHIEEQHADGELFAYVLKEDVREEIRKERLFSGLKTLLPPDLQVLAESIKNGSL